MSISSTLPTVVAVIPARGGSKGVPGKNLAPVHGIPLVERAIAACLAAESISLVVVSTDSPRIASAAEAAGARVVERPAELSTDESSSEAALLHALNAIGERWGVDADILVFVQCTSPFTTAGELDDLVRAITEQGADSAFTAAPFHGFLWNPGDAGDGSVRLGARGVNHESAVRQRRQDRPEEFLETGAAYAMRVDGFRRHGHRFFGEVALVGTDAARVLEIDEPHDLDRARALAPLLEPGALPDRSDVDAVVLDFDGTQTDDRVWVDAEGHETVAVSRADGMGIARLRKAGIPVLILSSETNPVVAARARKLGVPVLHGIAEKDVALKEWCAAQAIDPQRVLYVGNDVNDLPCFNLVGWPVAVADAKAVVRQHARAVARTPGGHGVVHEIATALIGNTL